MVVTRSMSGATKKTDTKIAMNHEVAKRAGKQTKERKMEVLILRNKVDSKNGAESSIQEIHIPVTWRRRTNYSRAQEMFMMDYVKQYYEKHPPRPTVGLVPWDIYTGGTKIWNSMSDSEKAPYIDHVKKMNDPAYVRKLVSGSINFPPISGKSSIY